MVPSSEFKPTSFGSAQRISLAVRRKVTEQIKTVCMHALDAQEARAPPRATRAPLQPVLGG